MAAEKAHLAPYKFTGRSYENTDPFWTIHIKVIRSTWHEQAIAYIEWFGDPDADNEADAEGGKVEYRLEPQDLRDWKGLLTYLYTQRPGIRWEHVLEPGRVALAPSLPPLNVTASNEGELDIVRLDTVKSEQVQMRMGGRLAMGKLNLLVGDPGDGKSWASMALASGFTNGAALPGETDGGEPVEVLLANFEDDIADTIRPRAEAVGVQLGRLHVITGAYDKDGRIRPFHTSDLPKLEEVLDNNPNIRVMIVDPVMSLVGSRTDVYRDNEVREALHPLVELARTRRIMVIGIMHLNKGTATKAIYRVSSSLGGFVGMARSVLLVAKDPDSKRRAMAHIKCNVGPLAEPLEFEISSWGVAWLGDAPDLSADRLLAPAAAPEKREAEEFLKRELGNGPKPSKAVEEQAQGEGITHGTLKRARTSLRIGAAKERKVDGAWFWALPQHSTLLKRMARGDD